ncbi:MAG: GTPase HflX, partial [Acidobacteriota bacterium]
MAPEEVASPELLRHLTSISREIGRQVGVLVTRDGAIRNVVVGDATKIDLPDIGRLRGGVGRFRALRLVHTHLRGEPLTADDLNDLALLRLDAVAMVQADAEGSPGAVEVAMMAPAADDEDLDLEAPHREPFRRFQAADIYRLDLEFDQEIRALEDEFTRLTRGAAG